MSEETGLMPITDARRYKALLICPSKPMAHELGPILSHGLPLAPVLTINTYPNRRQLVDVLKSFEPALCFLDMTSGAAAAFQAMAELHTLAPAVPVIALLAPNAQDIVLQCLRQGAADFLVQPFTTDQIDACVDKIAKLLPASSRADGGKVVAVIPSKGGAGATTVACNLAFQCKRLGAKRILLADMDPLSGTVSFLLKLKSTYTFLDVLQRQTTLDGDLWKQMVVPLSGLEVLLAPEAVLDPATELPPASAIVDYAQSAYEASILDCASPYGPWNLSIARMADQVLIVSTNELASLAAAQRAMIYLEHHKIDMSRVKLVINRHVKDVGLHLERIPKACNAEVFQVLPNEPDAVQRSLLDGKPIAANSAIGKSLAAMSDRLLEFKPPAGKKDAGKGGLLSSFFKTTAAK